MPIINVSIDEVKRTIINESVIKIVNDLITYTKMADNIIVIYNDDMDSAKTNIKNNTQNTEQEIPTLSSARKIIVSSREEYNEDAASTTAVNQDEYLPIFIDEKNDIKISINYIQTDITLDITYISASRTECIRWRDNVREKISQMRDIYTHDIEYNIMLPNAIETFICDMYDQIHRLDTNLTLEQYFKQHSTNRIVPITDLVGNNKNLVVKEKQVRIIGKYDFSPYPSEVEKDNDTGTYSIKFTYKYTIDKPAMLVLKFPLMVANRLVPNKYISHLIDLENYNAQEYRRPLSYSRSLAALSYFESHRWLEKKINTNLPLNIPYFDIYKCRKTFDGYAAVTTVLVDIDETNKRLLLNLNDLGSYYIDNEIINFIKDVDRQNVTKPYQSYMYIGLEQRNKHFNNFILEIDNDLNVSSNIDLDLFKETRLIFSFIYDIDYVNKIPTYTLRQYPSIFLKYLYEFVLVNINYPDLHSHNKTLFSLYHYLVLNIYDFYIKKNYDVVKNIFTTIDTINHSLKLSLITYLHNNYPKLYNSLISLNILNKDEYNGSKYFLRFYRDINQGMRTQMNSFVFIDKGA